MLLQNKTFLFPIFFYDHGLQHEQNTTFYYIICTFHRVKKQKDAHNLICVMVGTLELSFLLFSMLCASPWPISQCLLRLVNHQLPTSCFQVHLTLFCSTSKHFGQNLFYRSCVIEDLWTSGKVLSHSWWADSQKSSVEHNNEQIQQYHSCCHSLRGTGCRISCLFCLQSDKVQHLCVLDLGEADFAQLHWWWWQD